MKQHGGNIYEKAEKLGIDKKDILDFSANISPLGIPSRVRQAMIDSVDELVNYPDPNCTALREAIAKAEGIKKEWIVCGNGGADLLFRIALALKPKQVLLPAPTFVEYEEAMRAVGSEILYTKLDESFQIDEHDIMRKMGGTFGQEKNTPIDLFILCNPNNPTGLLTKRETIIQLLDYAASNGIVVLVDECFLELYEKESDYTLKPYLGQYKNLFILKSFTKLYAIPGVRLGYLLSSNEEAMEHIKAAAQAWSVSHVAQRAGEAALKETTYKQHVIELVARENAFLRRELKKLGLTPLDGVVNYLFFYTKQIDLGERLEKKAILIRDCSNYNGLTKGYFRIAVKNREENEKLLEALRQIKEEVGGF